jgi:hypothetical protein
MANTLLTPSIISKETLRVLVNNLTAASRVNRQFEDRFVKIGSTLTVRKPVRYTVSSGPGLSIQDVTEPSTTITVNSQRHVDMQFGASDLALTIEEFGDRYIRPAAEALANQIDYDVISNFTKVNNWVAHGGAAGGGVTGFADVALAARRLDEESCPQNDRCLILNPASFWGLAGSLTSLFVAGIAEDALATGFIANLAGMDVYMDQNIQSQQAGVQGGSGATTTASQTGATINTNGWTASVTNLLRAGDVITFANVYAVNPQNRQSTGVLRNFVITAAVNSDGSGNAALPISPAIVTTGPYQNVNVAPAAAAGVTVLNGASNTTYAQNLAFHRDAFGLVTVPLELPEGVDFAAREVYKGISLRVVRSYDINNDVFPTRIDVLYGTTTFYPELACRLSV